MAIKFWTCVLGFEVGMPPHADSWHLLSSKMSSATSFKLQSSLNSSGQQSRSSMLSPGVLPQLGLSATLSLALQWTNSWQLIFPTWFCPYSFMYLELPSRYLQDAISYCLTAPFFEVSLQTRCSISARTPFLFAVLLWGICCFLPRLTVLHGHALTFQLVMRTLCLDLTVLGTLWVLFPSGLWV